MKAGWVSALAALSAVSVASARGYVAQRPTPQTNFTRWVASYRGSFGWSVSDQSGGADYAESSSGSYDYRAGEARGLMTFEVTFPTPCVQYGPPCPPRAAIALGNGSESVGYRLDDTRGPQTLVCAGRPDAQTVQPGFGVRGTYIRRTDSYRIVLDPVDVSQFDDPSDASCPGPNPMVAPLGDWYPTFSPGPVLAGFWTSASVDVAATAFAHNRLIVIPVAHAIDRESCGPTCAVTGSWSGTVVLRRL